MERRFLAQIAAFLTAGIVICRYRVLIGIPVLLLGFLAVNYRLFCRKRKRILLLLLGGGVTAFFAGAFTVEKEIRFRASYETVLEAEPTAELQGELYKKETADDQFLYYFKNVKLKVNKQIFQTNQAFSYFDTDDYPIGTILILKGSIRQFHTASNDGCFDQKKFYQSQKIDYRFDTKQVLISAEPGYQLPEALYRLDKKLKHNYTINASGDISGILQAMICGDKQAVEAGTKDAYRKAGISHILVISGVKTQNLAIPITRRNRINSAFVPLHIAKIYILKLCLDEEIIPRCRFPCSRGYFRKCINWQKKQ